MTLAGNESIAGPALWELISISSIVHFACVAWVVQHILRTRRDPIATMLWIVTAWSLPFLGFLIYLFFGINRVAAKTWKKETANQRLNDERAAREADRLPLNYWRSIRESLAKQPDNEVARQIDHAVSAEITDSPLLGGNDVHMLITGDEAFPAMLREIEAARHHIHLQSFIFAHDKTGRQFMELLAAKAREGVQVRLLYDRFGSTFAVWRGFFHRYRKVPNLHIEGWTMARPLKRQFQVNLRNHRKLLVIDGHTAYTGGINIQAEHTTRGNKPPIRDYHFKLQGPAVCELQYAFLKDWYYITDEDPDRLLCAEHFPAIQAVGSSSIRVVHGTPATELDEICDMLFACLVSARKSILAVTPYFVPTMDIIRALRNAALRGVDVRIVVPEINNHPYAGWAGRAYYEELLESGVRIYERRPPFMHAKGLVIDDAVAVIGTANLDVRSLKLNFETNLMVYDPAVANKLKAIMLEEVAMGSELNLHLWRKRPMIQRMKENAASILTPIL